MPTPAHVLRPGLLLLGLGLALSAGWGQVAGSTPDAAPDALAAASPESLRIGPGDLLQVTIFRENDLEQKVRVKDSGDVLLQLVGMVNVKGLPPAEAAEKIARRYKDGGFLNHPQVAVFVEESVSQKAAVLGEVQHPGLVPLTSSRSLLDVISEAGGLTLVADRHITIRRPGQAATTVFLSNNADKALADADVLVQPGDTILVPKAGIVYVLGDVGRPGGIVMQDDARLSLLQALSLASGVNKTAADNRARLLRKVNGVVVERPLELKAIERGQRSDPQLEADDIVFIPFSLLKNVALGATTIVASASSAAVYAAH
jgi:polysaccharide export outer membrane protein